VLQYPILGWQVSTGINGSFQSESVATFDRNTQPEGQHVVEWRQAQY
jgi:hypothetical protein